MRVLVCGGRNFAWQIKGKPAAQVTEEWQSLWDTLDEINENEGIDVIIHGNAKGADQTSGEWASERVIRAEEYPAKWNVHGRAAGPIRNQQMLDKGKPDLVVAFKGGVGTAGMVSIAKKAGIEVRGAK